jgi:hypothetical protein
MMHIHSLDCTMTLYHCNMGWGRRFVKINDSSRIWGEYGIYSKRHYSLYMRMHARPALKTRKLFVLISMVSSIQDTVLGVYASGISYWVLIVHGYLNHDSRYHVTDERRL